MYQGIQKIKKYAFSASSLVLTLVMPLLASAQSQFAGSEAVNQGQTATGLLNKIQGFIDQLVPVLIAVIFLFLIFEGVRYVVVQDEQKKTGARDGMIKAFIVLLVVLSIWGIIGLLANFLGTGTGGSLQQNDIPSTSF